MENRPNVLVQRNDSCYVLDQEIGGIGHPKINWLRRRALLLLRKKCKENMMKAKEEISERKGKMMILMVMAVQGKTRRITVLSIYNFIGFLERSVKLMNFELPVSKRFHF